MEALNSQRQFQKLPNKIPGQVVRPLQWKNLSLQRTAVNIPLHQGYNTVGAPNPTPVQTFNDIPVTSGDSYRDCKDVGIYEASTGETCYISTSSETAVIRRKQDRPKTTDMSNDNDIYGRATNVRLTSFSDHPEYPNAHNQSNGSDEVFTNDKLNRSCESPPKSMPGGQIPNGQRKFSVDSSLMHQHMNGNSSSPVPNSIYGMRNSPVPVSNDIYASSRSSPAPHNSDIYGSSRNSPAPMTNGIYGSRNSPGPMANDIYGVRSSPVPTSVNGIYGTRNSPVTVTNDIYGTRNSPVPPQMNPASSQNNIYSTVHKRPHQRSGSSEIYGHTKPIMNGYNTAPNYHSVTQVPPPAFNTFSPSKKQMYPPHSHSNPDDFPPPPPPHTNPPYPPIVQH